MPARRSRRPPLTPPVEVMLARAVDRVPNVDALPGGCVFDLKWDGYRAVAFRLLDGTFLQSRRGADLTAAFPEITAAVDRDFDHGVVVDGELVIWNDDSLDFAALQRRLAATSRARTLAGELPASFVAFDLLADGRDLRSEPFRVRRARLERRLADVQPPIYLNRITEDRATAVDWLAVYAGSRVGIEGVVIKGRDQPYEGGRRGWLKYRYRDTTDAIVGAVTGSLAKPDRLVLAVYRGDELAVVGATGSLNEREQRSIAPLLEAADDRHPWRSELGGGYLGHWGRDKVPIIRVQPSVVVEVSADVALDHGRWRHPVRYVRPRPDLTADDTSWPP